MRKPIKNLVIVHPVRSLRDLPESGRRHLLQQMQNYLYNCETEDRKLHCMKELVNRL